MKTLDEVIKANECCIHDNRCEDCPYNGIACVVERETDALHYLKEYKRISAKLEKIALGNITETLEKLDNPALTWDELKGMEGKPIWVEDEDCYSRWEIINGVYDDGISFGDYFLNKNEFGIVWQAYRKERK